MRPMKEDDLLKSKLFSKEGAPLRILSTSLGVALLANVVFMPGTTSAETTAPSSSTVPGGPKLVEWSNDAVKSYYDAAVDWNIPLPPDKQLDQPENGQGNNQQGQGTGSTSGGTTVINNVSSGGFGWNDLLLYHLMFNSGSAYSARSWTTSHPTYNYGTSTPYQPRTYNSGTFQNKPVTGSRITPKTSQVTGGITRRSTSSKPGGIGGKSSSFGSSSSKSSSSSSSHSSGGFGG